MLAGPRGFIFKSRGLLRLLIVSLANRIELGWYGWDSKIWYGMDWGVYDIRVLIRDWRYEKILVGQWGEGKGWVAMGYDGLSYLAFSFLCCSSKR